MKIFRAFIVENVAIAHGFKGPLMPGSQCSTARAGADGEILDRFNSSRAAMVCTHSSVLRRACENPKKQVIK